MGSGSDMQVVGVLLAAGSGRRFAASGGGNKLLAALPGAEHVAVAVASARAMLAVLPRVVAVVPDDDGQLGQALRLAGCDVTVCSNAAQGMGASLVHALGYSLEPAGLARSATNSLEATGLASSAAHSLEEDGQPRSTTHSVEACGQPPVPSGSPGSAQSAFLEAPGSYQLPQGWIIALADMPYVQHATIAALRDALLAGAGIAVPNYHGRRGNPVGFGSDHLDQLLALQGDQGARAIVKAHSVTEVAVDDPGILRDIDTVDDLAGK